MCALKEEAAQAYRVDAVHLAIALHQEGALLLTQPGKRGGDERCIDAERHIDDERHDDAVHLAIVLLGGSPAVDAAR
jgi:hypothetical protein